MELEFNVNDLLTDEETPSAISDQLGVEEYWQQLAAQKDHRVCFRYRNLATVMLVLIG